MLDQRRTISAQCPSRVAVDDDGLKMGMGSVLIRMTGSALGAPRLAIEADAARCLALLSVAGRRQVQPGILRHIEAASGYWQRGEKALANFRLLYAGLPHLHEPADVYRLRLAEYLLDEGTSPQTLMKELGLEAVSDELDKYSPDQPRVPAGNGRRSGEWDSDGGSQSGARRIVVAAEGDTPENKNNSDGPANQHHAGQLPEDEHGFQLNPLPGLPRPGGQPIPIGGEAMPPLQRIHPDSTYESGTAKSSLDFLRGKSTEYIVESLAPTSEKPLRATPDGRIYDGNTRVKILQERGYDINSLPRSKY